MGAWGKFWKIGLIAQLVALSFVGCSKKSDPWENWQPRSAPPVEESEGDINPPISSITVEPNHKLVSWRAEKPQDLLEAIPATPPESAVMTSEGLIYSSTSATVFVPKGGKPRILSSDSWKIVGKLPNEKVIVESGMKLYQLDVKSGQVSFVFDIRNTLKSATLSWETMEDSKGILLNINAKSHQGSGIYRFDGVKLEPVFTADGETFSPFSIRQAFPNKFALIENINSGQVLLYDRSTLEVLEVPQASTPSTQGDAIVLADQRILSFQRDAESEAVSLQVRNAEGSWETLHAASDESKIELPDFAVEVAGKIVIGTPTQIGLIDISEGKFEFSEILDLNDDRKLISLVPLVNQSDQFYMIQGDKLYLLLSQPDETSGQNQGQILEISSEGQVQFLPAEVDVLSLSVFIRVSNQEILAVMDTSEGNFEAIYRFQPGLVEEILKPNRLLHNLINYGVQFVARISTNRWLMGSRGDLIAFESQTKSVKGVELKSTAEAWKRDWIGFANGLALSIDRETFDTPTHRIVAWDANHKSAEPIAGWSFDLPPNFELAEARLESVEGEGKFAKFHIWARFQEVQGSQQITQDVIVKAVEGSAELNVELLPSSTFEVGNLGSPYVRTAAGNFELTNDAILSGSQSGALQRMAFMDISESQYVVDVASRSGHLVAVVLDKASGTTLLLKYSNGSWTKTESSPWIHSDIWISDQGKVHWKVLDPTDFDVSKLMRFESDLKDVREYPWDSGCTAEGHEIEGLGFVGIQSPIQTPRTCFFQE